MWKIALKLAQCFVGFFALKSIQINKFNSLQNKTSVKPLYNKPENDEFYKVFYFMSFSNYKLSRYIDHLL